MPTLSRVRQILFLLICFNASIGLAKIDDSIDIFFPKELKYLQYSQTEFPVFWWNFVVVDADHGKASFNKAREVCTLLKKYEKSSVKRLICGDELGGFVETLTDWSRDIVLRENFSVPSGRAARYKSAIDGSLAELSFISSERKDLFNLKREDPLDQWQVYLQKSQAMVPGNFQREQGFLLDPSSQRLIIPLQFAVEPKMKNVGDLMADLQKIDNVHLIGAHASAYANEKQVHADMDIVSLVGVAVLILFIAVLVLKGRLGALLLFPPVVLALTLAAWVTELFYGSIHGLTLAFGSGIVGLAIDYGLHGAFNSQSKQTWKSNSVGLLTTLVGLAVLACSGIPLIRQMMIFASLGIFLGFLFFYILCRYFPKYFRLKAIDLYFPDFRGSWIVILVLIVGGLAGCFYANLNFDLRRFNYQAAADLEATNWFFSQGDHKETFLLLHDKQDFPKEAANESQWAVAHNISSAGLGDYLPDAESQQTNKSSWSSAGCPYFKKELSSVELKVFAPFIENVCQKNKAEVLAFADLHNKDYLSSFVGKNQFISLFFAQSPEQKKEIREKFPEAHSLVESIQGFSDSLQSDLHWMIPAVFILCTLVLGFYYRSLFFVVASYIPFLSGLGLFLLANFIHGRSLDLISVLGLLMVFGFSVDYGVFVTDIYAFGQSRKNLSVVYSILGLAAFTNVIGFFPMMFAKHPILHQLGFALFFGTLGTYLGTRWGLASFLSLKKSDS